MTPRTFVRKHITAIAIIIYIIIFFVIQWIQPSFIYNEDGSLKQFGLGVRQKTVIPIWLVALITAILSYLFVLYYLAIPKLQY